MLTFVIPYRIVSLRGEREDGPAKASLALATLISKRRHVRPRWYVSRHELTLYASSDMNMNGHRSPVTSEGRKPSRGIIEAESRY